MTEAYGVLPIATAVIPYSVWSEVDNLPDYFFQFIVDSAKQSFLSHRKLIPMISLMGQQPSGPSSPHPQLIQCSIDVSNMMASHIHKDALEEVLPSILQRFGAFCVVTAMETWTLLGEDAHADVYETYDSLADHPNAIEALSFILEGAEGHRTELYPIQRSGDEISLGENIASPDRFSAENRFANLLRPPPKGSN